MNESQRKKYLEPYASGEAKSAIAISEPGAGGDPAGMKTRAVKSGDDWVINGRKIWISRVPYADFTIVMALTDPEKRARGGITAFIVEKGTPGFIIEREIPMLGGHRTYEVVFEDCRVPEEQVLGAVGNGFAPDAAAPDHTPPADRRLGARHRPARAEDDVRACAAARDVRRSGWPTARRSSGGSPTPRRKIHACRLMVLDAAEKQDEGRDVRTEASMIKVFATEMASEVVDHAMQTFGAMGVTKELPLQLLAQKAARHADLRGPERGPPHGDRAANAGRVQVGRKERASMLRDGPVCGASPASRQRRIIEPNPHPEECRTP